MTNMGLCLYIFIILVKIVSLFKCKFLTILTCFQFLGPPSQDLFYDHEILLDRAVDMLDPDLRPVPPQPNCPNSMQIYQNHRQMAADFVKFQTDLVKFLITFRRTDGI